MLLFKKIVWKNVSKNKNNNQRTMYLTLIGLCNLLFGWPIVIFLHLSGIEKLTFTSIYSNQSFDILLNIIGASFLGLGTTFNFFKFI